MSEDNHMRRMRALLLDARKVKMESIMRNHGTSLRLVFPRDRYYLDLLPSSKCSCVKTVELVYGDLGFLDFRDDSSWFPPMMRTIATKLKNLTHLTLSNKRFCPNLPLKPIAELLEHRGDTLQLLNTDSALPSFAGTKEDAASFLWHLSRATSLNVLKMGRSMASVWLDDRCQHRTFSRKMLEAVGELSALQEITVASPSHNQNNFFAQALTKLCQNEGRPLVLKIEFPSELHLASALPLQKSRVEKLIIDRPRGIGNCINRIVQGVNANKNLQELQISERFSDEAHPLDLPAAVGLLSGLATRSQSLRTLDLTLHLEDNGIGDFDQPSGEKLAEAIQRNTSLQRLKIGHNASKCSGCYLKFLVHILLGLAHNCCIQEVQLLVSNLKGDDEAFTISDHCEFMNFLSTSYGKDISQALENAKDSLLASLKEKRNVSLRKFKLAESSSFLDRSWPRKNLPFFGYAEEFWCFRHRALLDQPEDRVAWVGALINSKKAISDSFCMLQTNPSVFFTLWWNPAQSAGGKRKRMKMMGQEEKQSKCQKTESSDLSSAVDQETLVR